MELKLTVSHPIESEDSSCYRRFRGRHNRRVLENYL